MLLALTHTHTAALAQVIGHESAGVVTAVGSAVKNVAVRGACRLALARGLC